MEPVAITPEPVAITPEPENNTMEPENNTPEPENNTIPLPALELWRFARQDECRPALKCVRIEAGHGLEMAVAVATDGPRLTSYTWTCTEGERALLDTKPMHVYAASAKNIAAAARKARKARKGAVESVTLRRDADGRSIVARFGAQTWALPDHTVDGIPFPEWRHILPTRAQGPDGIKQGLKQVCFDPSLIADISAYLKAAGAERCALDIGSIGSGLSPLFFTAEVGAGHADFVVMPLRP